LGQGLFQGSVRHDDNRPGALDRLTVQPRYGDINLTKQKSQKVFFRKYVVKGGKKVVEQKRLFVFVGK